MKPLVFLFLFVCVCVNCTISGAESFPSPNTVAGQLLSEAPMDIDAWVRQDPRSTLAFLEERLPKVTDAAERIFWLQEMARAARFGGLFPQGLESITEAIDLAESLGDPAKILQVRREKAVLFHLNGQPDAAHSMINLTLRLADFYEMPTIRAALLNLRGVQRWQSGDLHSAARDLQEGIAILEEFNNPHDLASMNNNLGIVFLHMRQLERALEHYQIALAIKEAEEVEDDVFLASVLSNIGEVYTAQGNMAKALEVTYRSLQMEKRIGNPANIALSFYNLGEAYAKMGDHEQSFNYFTLALEIQTEQNFEWEKSGTLHRLAVDSMALNRLPDANEFLQAGLMLAYRLEAHVLIRDFYQQLAHYYILLDDPRLARHFSREHQRMQLLTSEQGLDEWTYHPRDNRRQAAASVLLPDTSTVHLQADLNESGPAGRESHWVDRSVIVAVFILLLLLLASLLVSNHRLNKSLNELRLRELSKY